MPWSAFDHYFGIYAWRLILLGICIIVLRRPPWVTALVSCPCCLYPELLRGLTSVGLRTDPPDARPQRLWPRRFHGVLRMHRRFSSLLHSGCARKYPRGTRATPRRDRACGSVPGSDLGAHPWHHHTRRQGLPPYSDGDKDAFHLVRRCSQTATSADGAAHEQCRCGGRRRHTRQRTTGRLEDCGSLYQYRRPGLDVSGTSP